MKCNICKTVRSAWKVTLALSILFILVAIAIAATSGTQTKPEDFQKKYGEIDQRQFRAPSEAR